MALETAWWFTVTVSELLMRPEIAARRARTNSGWRLGENRI